MQKPKFGEMVSFYNIIVGNEDQPPRVRAAMVNKVLNDSGRCQLLVFQPSGPVMHDADFSETPMDDHWSYPREG